MNTRRIYRKKSNTPRRFLSLLLSAGILISGIPGKPAKAEETKSAETSYVVLTDNTKTAKEVVKEFDGEKIENNTKLVEVDMTGAEARKLEKDNDVIYVEKNITLTASLEDVEAKDNQENLSDIEETLEIPNLEKLQWNRQAVGVTASAEVTDAPSETEPTDNLDKDEILLPDSTDISNKVRIEILDSGVSAGGDTYIEEYVDLTREISGEGHNPLFADDNGHGTAMAGVIGARSNNEGIKGINPNAGIYSVKALDSNNVAPLSRIIEGIYWGIENDMDIINMSFGTPADSEILHKAVRDAYAHGILVVAAAGNTAHQEVQYPAAYPEAIAVGSVNEAGELAEHTSVGTELELLAPGENVVSEDSLTGLTVVSGTSIATAQVTAVASLLMQNHPEKNGKFIRSLLRKSAKKINPDEQTTAGLIDYNYAEKIYEEFALSYTDTDITEIEPQNIEPAGDYSAEAEQMVQGLWDANTAHATLYGLNSIGDIDSTYLKIIKKIAPLADEIKGKYEEEGDTVYAENIDDLDNPPKGGFNPSSELHGSANYVGHAMYLWYLAYYLNSKKTGKSIDTKKELNNKINQSRRMADKKIRAICKNHGGMQKFYEHSDYKNLYYGTAYLLKCGISELNSISLKRLQLIALGYLTHLLGDVYSHRTIVPRNVEFIDGSELKKNCFLLADFKNNYTEIQKGTTEYRALKNYAIGGSQDRIVSPRYIDNPKFYSTRYYNAKNTTRKTLLYAIDPIRKTAKFDYRMLIPTQEKNSKLSRLKTYVSVLGDTTQYKGSWRQVSAND